MTKTKRTLIKNARIHNGLGDVLEESDILLDSGKISALGPKINENADDVIDASGCDILPGFVSVLGCWGGVGPGMNDYHLCESSDPISPHMNVHYVFMVDSLTASELYRYGITSSCLTPDFSNLFGGLGAVYKTWGFRPDDMLVKEKAVAVTSFSDLVKQMHMGKPGMNTSMGLLNRFIKALHEGEDYEHVSCEEGRNFSYRGEALADIISGRIPLILYTDSRSRFELMKAELENFPHIRYAINGIYDINLKKDGDIATGKQAVILNSIANSAAQYGETVRFTDISDMVQQGARIAISANFIPGDMVHKEALLWNANVFYKNGISCENVIKMITSIPADILGVSDRIGSLVPGKDADLTIWSGNPVTSFTAQLKKVFIEGEELSAKEKVRVCW